MLSEQVPVFCQEWGEISEDVLKMTEFAPDPEADAVIIFDIADIRFTQELNLETFRHTRVKILSEAGKEYATVKIPYWYEDNLVSIEAVCYHSDGEEFELDSDEIYDEGSGNWRQKVFAIPGVEVGSVIEYSYVVRSEYIYRLEPWSFQNEEYTLLSRLSVIIPTGFEYGALQMNIHAKDLDAKREEVYDNSSGYAEKVAKYTWIMRDIPSIKLEPYMTAVHDYYAQILFQVKSYHRRNINLNFAINWNDIARTVSKQYEPLFEQDGGIEDFTGQLIANTQDLVTRAKLIYEYIRTEIKPSKENALFSQDLKQPDEVFATKTGSSNERNLLLINMLRHASLNAYPLLISTRDHGRLFADWVQLQQFNRVLACLLINNNVWFLDTSDRFCPFGHLTPQSCVDEGLLVRDEEGVIVLLRPIDFDSKTTISTDAQLSIQGDMLATTEFKFEGYDAVKARNDINNRDITAYLKEKLEDISENAILDTFSCSNTDSLENPLIINAVYRLPGYMQILEHLHYFTLPYFTGIDKNPFIRQTRSFPIDFPYMFTESEVVRIHLPGELSLSSVPKREKLDLKALLFSKIFFTLKDGFESRRSFGVKTKTVSNSRYNDLKLIYDSIVNSDQTQIVLNQIKSN